LFGWTLLDSVYMVVITIFGVSYGEVNPLETPPEKIFTILVIDWLSVLPSPRI
jgi:voltage-gated potassium channel